MQRLPGARLRKAQIASLGIFVLMGHGALASVAWVPEYIDRLGVSFATWGTIIGFTALYGALAVVEVKLILYAIKKGPFHEQETFSAPAPEAPATPVAAPAVA